MRQIPDLSNFLVLMQTDIHPAEIRSDDIERTASVDIPDFSGFHSCISIRNVTRANCKIRPAAFMNNTTDVLRTALKFCYPASVI